MASNDNSTPASSGQALLHLAEALVIENALVAALLAPFTKTLRAIRIGVQTEWTRSFGSLDSQQSSPEFVVLMRNLSQRLAALALDPQGAVVNAAQRGLKTGVKHALSEIGKRGQVDTQISYEVYQYANAIARVVRQKIAAAQAIAGGVHEGSFAAVENALSAAKQAQNVAERAVRTVFNEHLNDGILAVIEHHGLMKLWLAEPDACPVCLALDGTVLPHGEPFDAEATFGTHAMRWLPDNGLQGPPRHPNCRCRLMAFDPDFHESVRPLSR